MPRDSLLIRQHQALVDLLEGIDPDVKAAEAVMEEGRKAGLPEPWAAEPQESERDRAEGMLARKYPTLAKAMEG